MESELRLNRGKDNGVDLKDQIIELIIAFQITEAIFRISNLATAPGIRPSNASSNSKRS